jgi:hypothetical protein
MTLKDVLSFQIFRAKQFCSRHPSFSSRKFGAFLTMQFFLAMKLADNRNQRHYLTRCIEVFQIRKILADSFIYQNTSQQYEEHFKFLLEWLILTGCKRYQLKYLELAIELGSYPARAFYAIIVMNTRLGKEFQQQAFAILQRGNAICCPHCTGALALFYAFNTSISARDRNKGGATIDCWFFQACISASRGSWIGKRLVVKLLEVYASSSDDAGRPLRINSNDFLKNRFPNFREPSIDRSSMLSMAEDLENELRADPDVLLLF